MNYQPTRRLVEIEQDIAANDGLITPEMEAEIEAVVREQAQAAAEMVVEFKVRHDRLKTLIDKAKKVLAHLKDREESYRGKLTNALTLNAEGGGTRKLKADDGLWTATLIEPKQGRVEITGEVPAEYMREEIVRKPDTEMIRALLEAAGDQSWAKIVREAHVRVLISDDRLVERDLKQTMGELK